MRRLPRAARALVASLLVLAAGVDPALAQRRAPDKAQPAPAPTPQRSGDPITLAGVLETAVRQSPELASATIDVEVARANLLAASGIEDWLLTASGRFSRRRQQAVEGELGSTESDVYAGEVGISKLLPTGGTIGLTGSLERSDTLLSFVGMESESKKYSAEALLSLNQPLLRDFGSTVTYAARTQAEHAQRAAELQKRAAAQTMLRQLVVAYWEVAYAHADLEIRRSSLDLARERRRLTETSAKLGQVAATEIVAVDQIIAQREEEILAAELAITQQSLQLRRLAGLEIGAAAIDLAPGEPLAVEALTIDPAVAVQKAFETSPELAALAARGKGAKLEVEVAENGTLPRLDLGLSLGPIGTGTKPSDTFESLVKLDGYQANASLSYQQALGNRAAEGRTAAARAELRRVQVDERTLRAEIALAAVQAVKLAESARQRITLAETAIELSEKNVKAEVGRFELGKSTNFDVLARQEELKQARLRRARAVVDYLLAIASLDALTGEILGKYGVTIE